LAVAAAAAVGLVERSGAVGGAAAADASADATDLATRLAADADELILVAPVLDRDARAAHDDGASPEGSPSFDPPRSSDHLYDATEPTLEQLSDLRHLPSRALGVPFRVHAVVCEIGGPWEPYFTRFDRATWRRVALWSDDAPLWERDAFDDPLSFAFVRVGGALDDRLATAKPYDRVVVEGVVREVFAGEPWVELWSVRPAEPGLTEAGVFHAVRALEAQAKGLGPLARSELDKALAAPLPEHQRAALEVLAATFEADGE